jgi:hypothetical protein
MQKKMFIGFMGGVLTSVAVALSSMVIAQQQPEPRITDEEVLARMNALATQRNIAQNDLAVAMAQLSVAQSRLAACTAKAAEPAKK